MPKRKYQKPKPPPANKYVLYILFGLKMAAVYGVKTYIVVYPLVAAGYIFVAHLGNFALVVAALVFDKMEERIMLKRENNPAKNRVRQALRLILSPRIGGVSFKSALYLFYFAILIFSVLMRSEVPLNLSDNFQEYIGVLEVGVLFLIAGDMFKKQLLTDAKHISENEKDDKR